MIEGGTAHSAEQNRRGSDASLNCVGGKRVVDGSQRRTADVLVLELKPMAECVGNGLENEDGLFGDFRANAVAGENREV